MKPIGYCMRVQINQPIKKNPIETKRTHLEIPRDFEARALPLAEWLEEHRCAGRVRLPECVLGDLALPRNYVSSDQHDLDMPQWVISSKVSGERADMGPGRGGWHVPILCN